MNIHALQGYEAIAEAQELMAVSHQIVTPQSNSVIIGLVQDSLVGAYRLTAQDCFFTTENALDLLTALHYHAPGRGASASEYADTMERSGIFIVPDMPEPAILKAPKAPRGLYTGHQLASMLLPRTISYTKDPSSDLESLRGPTGLTIKNGEILAGRLVKSHFSASGTGLVYAIWRLYGAGGAHKFISDAQRLFVKHLAHDGPTQSIVDCLMGTEATTLDILAKNLGRSDAVLSLDLPEAIKEAKSSSILQETLRAVGASVLAAVRPESGLANCVNSGSKGNVMNIAQIGGCVGQQTVYGRRVPWRQTRLGPRTLIYYAPGDARAEARGFVSNSYVSGLTPAEFFEHQMAGREGIVATAVNTSESGYNQRRMIKGQESQCLGYDGTVRVSNNAIIQTFYGGDDLDGSRLERVRLSGLMTMTSNDKILGKAISVARRYVVWRANLTGDLDLQVPCGVNVAALARGSQQPDLAGVARRALALHARHHSSARAPFNISVAALVIQCATHWPADIEGLFKLYAKSLVAAGEGVGPLGATSIGEPSMQMTLNVFHYAGISDKNVTITGLPRFKQLINGVDTYETANMTAVVRNFESIDDALQVSCVKLGELLSDRPTVTFEAAHPGFKLFGTQRGPFAAKFCASGQTGPAGLITINLSWQACARRNIKTSTVARSLRDMLSYDGIVKEWPHWHGTAEAARIEVFLAPWLDADNCHAIAEAIVAQHQVRGIDYIKNAIVFQEKRFGPDGVAQSRHVVETEGSNMLGLAACPFVVPETIRTTNVVEAAQVLGISAGLVVMQNELNKVLSFDSSYIDPRHTWLLTDTMGRCGSLAAMNRHHMESLGSSLLQRASFEQSLDVFEEGAAFGLSDPLAGATERIITGQPVCIGTGLVGIVSTATMPEQESEVLVAPLEPARPLDVDRVDRVVVAPMASGFSRPEPTYDPAAFAIKLADAPKVSTSDFLDAAAMAFRETAATRRTVPSLQVVSKLSEHVYKAALAACWSYGYWTTTESSDLVTLVTWAPTGRPAARGLTTIAKGVPASALIEDIKTQADGATRSTQWTVSLTRPLTPQEVPFGVESTRVIMRQQCRWTKGPFSLTLAREWTGATNTETEAAVLATRGTPVAILDIIDGEAVLQNRCTDVQLGNALYARLP